MDTSALAVSRVAHEHRCKSVLEDEKMKEKMIGSRRRLALLFSCLLLLIGLSCYFAPGTTVAAAFDQSAYNAATYKGTIGSMRNVNTGTYLEDIRVYIDANNTLHVSGSSAADSGSDWIFDTNYSDAASSLALLHQAAFNGVSKIVFDGPLRVGNNFGGLFQNYFTSSTSLTSISGLENINTSAVTSMENWFRSLSVTSISGSANWDTSNVTNMGNMFSNCTNLQTIDSFANWNVSKVGLFYSMFEKLPNLSPSVFTGLANWNTSSATRMSNMFALDEESDSSSPDYYKGIDKQSDYTIPVGKWDVSHVANMNSVFKGRSGMSTLDVSGWRPQSAQSMDHLFAECQSLKTLDTSQWVLPTVTDLSYAFVNTKSLGKLEVGGFGSMPRLSSATLAFAGSGVAEIVGLDQWRVPSLTNAMSMFRSMSNIKSITTHGWGAAISTMSNGMADCASLETADLTGLKLRSTYAVAYFFQMTDVTDSTDANCDPKLTKVIVGPSLTTSLMLPVRILSPQALIQGKMSSYALWRGETHDLSYVAQAVPTVAGASPLTSASGASFFNGQTEYKAPASGSDADRTDVLRLANDLTVQLVDNDGNAVKKAGIDIKFTSPDGTTKTITTDSDGKAVLSNQLAGAYKAQMTAAVPSGWTGDTDVKTATLAPGDALVNILLTEDNDADLVSQYPAAGGRGQLFWLAGGIGLILLGGTGAVYYRRQRD